MSAQFYMLDCGRTYDVGILQDAIDFVARYPDFIEKWIRQVDKLRIKRKLKGRGKTILLIQY